MSSTYVGNLTRDPELKFLNDGKALVNFSIAVSRGTGDKEYTSYFDCVAFGSLAENIADLKKGTRLVVSGSFRQERYEKDGQKREKVTLTADHVGAELRFAKVEVTKNTNKASDDF